MADNVTTQSATPATLPDLTPIGAAEATFSGDTVKIGLAAIVEVSGSEGSRTAAMISPATTGKQDTGNTSLASIDGKITAVNTGAVTITALPNEGQQTMANSISVAIASNQTAVLVDGSAVTQPVSNAGLTELAAAINGASQLDVNIAASAATLTVASHAVTNAGTFAVQDAAAEASLSVLDDWDESDRAKVNTIVGQVGVQGASGVVTALTQRVVLATDVALPAGNNNIGDVDIASSALPTGASTLAEQQSQTTHLATIAGDTTDIEAAVELIDDAVYVDDADWTDNTSKHINVGGIYQSTQHTVTDGDVSPIQLDVNGNIIESNSAEVVSILTAIEVDTSNLPGIQSVLETTLDASIFNEDIAATAGDKGIAVLAVRRDADTSLVGTDNDYANLQVNVNGALKVEIFDGGDSHTVDGTVGVSGTVAVTQSGTWDEVGINDSGNSITVDNAALSVVGGGVEATALRVTIASDSTGLVSVDDNGGALTVDNGGTFVVQVDGAALTALQLIDDPIIVDDAAFTPATSKVMMAGFEADEASTDSVDEGDAGAARMTLDRKVIVTPQPHTAGGLSIFKTLDLDETEEDVKTAAGQVYGYHFVNRTTAALYLKFYNDTAANVIVGTTVPVMTLEMPANASDHIAGHISYTHGIAFSAAICVAVTTGFADNDAGAPATNAAIVHVFYK